MVVFVVISLSFPAQAEKKKNTYTLTNRGQTISKTTISPGDFPNHELNQEVVVRTQGFNQSDPNLQFKEAWLYHQDDSIAGTGFHRGRFVGTYKDGDKIYVGYVKEPIKPLSKKVEPGKRLGRGNINTRVGRESLKT
jgi:hypothetical protein